MSRALLGSSSQYLTAALVVAPAPCTLVAWVNAPSWPAATQTLVTVGDSANSAHYSSLTGFNANAFAVSRNGGAATSSGGAGGLDVDTWHFAAARFTSATSRQAQRDLTRGTVGATSITHAVDRLRIGRRPDGSGDYYTGKIAHVAVFAYAVSDDDLDALAGGVNPLALAVPPVHYWPLTRGGLTDRVGSATLTNTGSTFDYDNPDVDDPPYVAPTVAVGRYP